RTTWRSQTFSTRVLGLGTPARSPRHAVGDVALDLDLLAPDELEGHGVGAGLLGDGGGDTSDQLGLLLRGLVRGDVELDGGHNASRFGRVVVRLRGLDR